MRHLLANWGAALKLPFVYLGWARDFWKDFERYPALEAGLPSTFFVIPFQGKPGRGVERRLGASGTSFRLRRSPISKTASTVSAQPDARSDCTESMHGVTARKPVRRWSSFSVSRHRKTVGCGCTGCILISSRPMFSIAPEPIMIRPSAITKRLDTGREQRRLTSLSKPGACSSCL